MNADELRSRRREIVVQSATLYTGDCEHMAADILRQFDALDAAANAPRNAYYEFINRFDTLYKLFKAAEGNPPALEAAADMMIAALERFKVTLGTSEVQS